MQILNIFGVVVRGTNENKPFSAADFFLQDLYVMVNNLERKKWVRRGVALRIQGVQVGLF